MNRTISILLCLLNIQTCLCMQHNEPRPQKQYDAQAEQLLNPCPIPNQRNIALTNRSLNQKLHSYVQNDDLNGVLQLLPRYEAHYDLANKQISVFFAAQNRVHKFAKLNSVMNKGEWLPNKRMQATFIRHRKAAILIYEKLNKHRDEGLHRAIDTLNVHLVKRYAQLGARLEWAGGTGTSFDHLERVYTTEMKTPDNLDKKNRVLAIKKILLERRNLILYWKIKYPDYTLVHKMIGIGASPHCYIQEEHKTALAYAEAMAPKPAVHDDQRTKIYELLKQIEERYQSEKRAREQQNTSADDPSFDMLDQNEDRLSHLERLTAENVQPDEGHLASLEKLASLASLGDQVADQPFTEFLKY